MVYADKWAEDLANTFVPKRDIKTFVTDVNFKSVFITRYFRPIKPPEELTSKGLSSEALSVSCISILNLFNTYNPVCNQYHYVDRDRNKSVSNVKL